MFCFCMFGFTFTGSVRVCDVHTILLFLFHSPDPCVTNHHDAPLSSPLGTSATSTGAASSSLPDLTNIEFSSGLDEPLERDEPRTHQPAMMGNPLANYPMTMQQQPMTSNSFFSPPASGPGPSKLLYTSLPPLSHPVQPNTSVCSNVQIPSLSPRHTTGFQFPVVHGSGSPGPKQPGPGMRQVSPLAAFQSSQSQLTKSPTMPDFRSLHSIPAQVPFMSHEYPTTPRLKPILPNSLPGGQMRTHTLMSTVGGATAGGGGARGGYDSSMGMNDQGNCHPGHAPMTIVIQSPHNPDKLANTMARNLNERQSSHPGNLPSPLTPLQQQQSPAAVHPTPSSPGINSPMLSSPSGPVASSPFNSMDSSSYQGSPPKQLAATFSNHNGGGGIIGTMGRPREGEHVPVGSGGGVGPSGVASLPNTPTLVMGMQSPMLPSYIEARQQQALQEKFASINVGRNEAMIRSHSEENLQKIQKDKGELMQQNPFMGTLTNANSVPCVYVESQNIDNFQENPESPPTIDSPSTSASYASSPPPVRPYWMDMNNDFVFQEWALEAGTSGIGGGVSGGGIGMPMHRNSPPHHHRSLTDLIQTTIPALNELSSSKAQQLSLPSVAMTDLTMEEHLDRPPESPSEFLTQTIADFEMDESALELIKNDIPYDMHALNSDAGILAQSNSFFSSPDYFRNN